jgi:transposase
MKSTTRQGNGLPAQLAAVNLHAAGIDIGAQEQWGAVPPGSDVQPVRRFGAWTADLEALADWLQQCQVTTVAMESTGVYWIPPFELLEARGLTVGLADAREVQRAPGRPKTDIRDCQWLQRLHTYGLVAAAFRPPEHSGILRSYLRQRAMLGTYTGQHSQHMQKALTQMNRKLQHVVSAITSVTGRAISKASGAGERDPVTLARFRDRHCRHSEAEIARALQGTWRTEHRFALHQAVELYEFYHRQIAACDQQIAAHLQTLPDQSRGKPVPATPRHPKRRRNDHHCDARLPLFRATGVELTALEGIHDHTALVLLREIGTDMSRWPTEKHFAAWLGLCPLHKISGGKVLARKVRPSANRAAVALRLAASCLHHSQSALGAFFRHLKARLGTPKAVVATAHKLARLVYRLLKHGEAYVAQGIAEYEQTYRARVVQSFTRKAKALGYKLLPTSDDARQASSV